MEEHERAEKAIIILNNMLKEEKMSKTEELEFEIYQQIKGLTPRQQRIIYENLKKIKFNMIQYGKMLASGRTKC